MRSTPARVVTLDLLRGFASLSVCWFHLTNGNEHFLEAGWLRSSGEYGWIGVNVFFVISGFIIPYALAQGGYAIADYGRFLLKRILRLDPPYLATILLVIVLGYLTSHIPGFRGPPFHVSVAQVLVHLGYANVFLGYQWLNPVFWTLAIELQYYLLVGLLFPLINTKRMQVSTATLLCLSILALVIPGRPYVFHWLFLFMLGIVTFQFRRGYVSRHVYLVQVAALMLGAWRNDGLIVGLAGATAALIIAFINVNLDKRWTFLGLISYSLYLLHAPIGGRVINLGERLGGGLLTKLAVLATALAVALVAAWIFYRLIERPAQRWSAALSYRRRVAAPTGFGPRSG
jgi:peptidoglycan/LPS O-acetylase OafA/YrhL